MTKAQAQALGNLMYAVRQRRGLSLEAVEAQCGVSNDWLFRFEKGRFTQPSPERLARLAEFLDVDAASIDAMTGDYLANSLPSVRTYFRSKQKASDAEITEIEAAVQAIHKKYERRNNDDTDNDKASKEDTERVA